MHLASLDVKTACDVAKQEVIAEILEGTGVHGLDHRGAGGDDGLDGIATLESCETQFQEFRGASGKRAWSHRLCG